MKTRHKILIVIFLLLDLALVLSIFISGKNIGFLNPHGMIALKERNILITAVLLATIVVIPVFIATFLIVWKYRADNHKSNYAPEWTGNNRTKLIWWSIPTSIIIILAVIGWKGAHALDPYRPIESGIKPITIQVVALNWKWLFIYPEQNIATVNFIELPVHTPVTFQLTADAPMNSFWIPQLGGQMYAMPGMDSRLHLIADEPGDFPGSEVEINGSGFAGMKFTARARSENEFKAWVEHVQTSSRTLNQTTYADLTKPSEYNKPAFYALVEKNLYNKIMMKYIAPQPATSISPSAATPTQSTDNMKMQNMNY